VYTSCVIDQCLTTGTTLQAFIIIYICIHHKMTAHEKEEDRQTENCSGRNPQANKILI